MTDKFSEEFVPLTINQRVIECTQDYAVVLKLPGDSSEDTIPQLFEEEITKQIGHKPEIMICPHRLDIPVSGIQIIALTNSALKFFSNEFAQQRVQKTYWAVVEGINYTKKEDVLSSYLLFNPQKKKAYLFKEEKRKTKKVSLAYKIIGQGERYSFVEVKPYTGRTHQIRVQLADIGMHIKGDVKYGSRRADTIPGVRLYAKSIECFTPNEKALKKFEAPIFPLDNLWQEFEKMNMSYYEQEKK